MTASHKQSAATFQRWLFSTKRMRHCCSNSHSLYPRATTGWKHRSKGLQHTHRHAHCPQPHMPPACCSGVQPQITLCCTMCQMHAEWQGGKAGRPSCSSLIALASMWCSTYTYMYTSPNNDPKGSTVLQRPLQPPHSLATHGPRHRLRALLSAAGQMPIRSAKGSHVRNHQEPNLAPQGGGLPTVFQDLDP